MIIDERYKKEYVPEDPTGNKKLSIQLWFDVIDIVEINEPNTAECILLLIERTYRSSSTYNNPKSRSFCLPCFLNWQSPWCFVIAFLGPRKSQPAPAYWQATRVPEHRYFKWSSKLPLWSSSEHESEFGHVTICLSNSLKRKKVDLIVKWP